MTAVAESTGSNRIFPASSIVYPMGNPNLQGGKELELRTELMKKALALLTD